MQFVQGKGILLEILQGKNQYNKSFIKADLKYWGGSQSDGS
jgi:hypothetical protein